MRKLAELGGLVQEKKLDEIISAFEKEKLSGKEKNLSENE